MVITEDNFFFFFSKERGNYLVMPWVERKDSPLGCHVICLISFENVYFTKYFKMFFGPLEQQQMYIQELYLLIIMKPHISSTYSNWYAWLQVLLIFIALTRFLLSRQQFSCITPHLQHFHIWKNSRKEMWFKDVCIPEWKFKIQFNHVYSLALDCGMFVLVFNVWSEEITADRLCANRFS